MKGLLLRADRLCVTADLPNTEMERIYSELLNNSNSKRFINRVKSRIKNQAPLERNWTSTVCIPCVPKISQAVNPEGILVAFALTNTLGRWLTHIKDSVPKYQVGRLNEGTFAVHQEALEKLERRSIICLHVLETEHNVDFDSPEILYKYWPINRDRMSAEQWCISHQPEECRSKGKKKSAWNYA